MHRTHTRQNSIYKEEHIRKTQLLISKLKRIQQAKRRGAGVRADAEPMAES